MLPGLPAVVLGLAIQYVPQEWGLFASKLPTYLFPLLKMICFSSPSPVICMKADPEVPPRLPAPLLRPLLDRELLLAAVLRVVGRREFVAGRLDRIGLGGEHALLSTVEDGPVISGYLHEGGEKSFHECWKGCWLNGNLVGVFPPTLVVGRSSYRVSGCEKKGKARAGRRRLEKEGSGKVPELELSRANWAESPRHRARAAPARGPRAVPPPRS